jgi:hypothetical protein
MRKINLLLIFTVLSISCFSQDIEICSSISTSTSYLFQNATGIGLQYFHDFGPKSKLEIGIHYNQHSSFHDEVYSSDADPSEYDFSHETFDVNKISIRLSRQKYIKNNESMAFSMGPEISYNFYWGKHNNSVFGRTNSQNSTDSTTFYLDTENHIANYKSKQGLGIGLLTQTEIKNIFTPKLSFCINIRPELCFGEFGGIPSTNEFNSLKAFIEFLLGLKYRLK